MPFLVTPPLPEMLVEIAFDSGFATPEGDRTWTDVSEDVEGALSADITYGRSDELATPDANSLTLTLDNRDGRFTPKKETLADGSPHPYFPNVKKGKPIRVSVRYAGVWYVRFTGYINEWPVTWPDGTDSECVVTLSARSRKARLGQTAPLTSAIRAAYLDSEPDAYWPMDEQNQNPAGQYIFRDITNTPRANKQTQSIAVFSDPASAQSTWPVTYNRPGPTDEADLIKIPASRDVGLFGTYWRYIGAGTAIKINSGGEVTAEVVFRWSPSPQPGYWFEIIDMFGPQQLERLRIYAADVDSQGTVLLATQLLIKDDTGAVVGNGGSFASGPDVNSLSDGNLHHVAVTMSNGGTTTKLYYDGILLDTDTLAAGAATGRFTNIAFGADALYGSAWLGHGAVYDRALTDDEIATHAAAATARDETPEERVVRVAGRVGVPADEVDVEDTIAANLGPQAEAGRSAAEVLDEAATGTGGVLHDGRDGHLVMRARNSRYNASAAFELSGELQEIQGDLTFTDDHRYTKNTIEFTRAGTEDVPETVVDQDSVDEHGVFAETITIVSSSPSEVQTFAQDRLYRFADPAPRVSQVSVDLTNLDADQRDRVLEADVDTRFALVDLAGQAPADPTHVFFEGAEESISATQHTMTINTTPGDLYQNVLILDDPVRGELDADNVLAY